MKPISSLDPRDILPSALYAAAPSLTEPVAMTVPHAVQFSGIGRSRLYELMNAGQIEAVKAGNRTLVLTASIRAYLADLPAAFPKREG